MYPFLLLNNKKIVKLMNNKYDKFEYFIGSSVI